MSEACTFILREYVSPSGYRSVWETQGETRDIASPFRYGADVSPIDSFKEVTVRPGQFIYHECSPNDDTSDLVLIQVPEDPKLFREFCEASERHAGQTVFDRINSYKQMRRGPFDYSNDFDGVWLQPCVVETWGIDDEDRPLNLQEALEFYWQKGYHHSRRNLLSQKT